MSNLSKDQILAASKGWVASLLNFFPGLGSGYLYQRRWIPYFLTIAAVTAWFAIGIILQGDKEPSQTEQLIGISVLLSISIFTLIEANLAYKKAVNKVLIEQKVTTSTIKKGWFK
tara:strand:- start:1003 stop:1347 length:345 start_codon:yes stop_codon:yes gene_type:complete